MTDAVLDRPAARWSPENLAYLHADLPLAGLELVEFGDLDAEAITLIEWGLEQPMFPAEIQPVRT
ncbi:hypothetical protein [Deinococcus sp.]|uniref:hypothetical protein n=1 Tax=Deinococcus sp. TaxID=47478 RepID=UPI002869EC4C|nr:hypothetical protein [Deinococcus sp.]